MSSTKHRKFLQVPAIEIGNTDYLSPRETETALYIAAGETAKACAQSMSISVRTVNANAENAMIKLDAPNRPALVAKCFSLGILRTSMQQKGGVSLAAIWLMLGLTLTTLVLDDNLIRVRPSKARSNSTYRVSRASRTKNTKREMDHLDPFQLFGADD